MMVDFHIIIPARFNSTRLPGKALLEIVGKPLIQRVYENTLLCGAASVTIATDDQRIQTAAQGFGANVCMTSIDHPNGTDRLAEAVTILGLPDQAIVVNIQGDEPFLSSESVLFAVRAMQANPLACMTTLATPIRDIQEISDPSIVKVVCDKQGFALYFSRAAIPFDRDGVLTFSQTEQPLYYRHLGLYAYRVATLRKYKEWGGAPLESVECLEQLRLLWHGQKIHVTPVNEPLPPGIDTEADLAKAREYFNQQIERVV